MEEGSHGDEFGAWLTDVGFKPRFQLNSLPGTVAVVNSENLRAVNKPRLSTIKNI